MSWHQHPHRRTPDIQYSRSYPTMPDTPDSVAEARIPQGVVQLAEEGISWCRAQNHAYGDCVGCEHRNVCRKREQLANLTRALSSPTPEPTRNKYEFCRVCGSSKRSLRFNIGPLGTEILCPSTWHGVTPEPTDACPYSACVGKACSVTPHPDTCKRTPTPAPEPEYVATFPNSFAEPSIVPALEPDVEAALDVLSVLTDQPWQLTHESLKHSKPALATLRSALEAKDGRIEEQQQEIVKLHGWLDTMAQDKPIPLPAEIRQLHAKLTLVSEQRDRLREAGKAMTVANAKFTTMRDECGDAPARECCCSCDAFFMAHDELKAAIEEAQ